MWEGECDMRSDNGGRRYDDEPKLNYKKLVAVVIGLAVVIMMIVSIIKIINDDGVIKEPNGKNYFTIYSSNKWGVIDDEGNVVINPTYEEMIIIPNKENPIFICVYDVNDEKDTYKIKVINEKNEEILKGYEKCEPIDNYDSKGNIWYEDNVLRVKKGGKVGLIDFTGKELLPCEYTEITALKGATSNFLVTKDGNIGLVNEKGQIIIPVKYQQILTLKEGYKNEYIIIDEQGLLGLISTSGTILFDHKYESIKHINSSEAYVVSEEGVVKLVEVNGNVIIEGEYDDILHYKGDNIIVVKDGNYGIINKQGEQKVPGEYEDLKYAFSIYFIAKKGGSYGIINTENEQVVEFKYMNMNYIESGGFIQADVSETESVILDNNLALKLTGIISEINIDKGYIRVYADNNYKYYNFKLEEKKSSDILTSNTIFLSKGENGKYGYVDKSGKTVIGHIYDDATEQNKYGYAAIKKDGVWGSVDKAGNLVLAPSVNLDDNIYINFIGKWHLAETGLYYVK